MKLYEVAVVALVGCALLAVLGERAARRPAPPAPAVTDRPARTARIYDAPAPRLTPRELEDFINGLAL